VYRRIPVDGKTEELAQWGVWCLFLGESASTLRVCSGMCIACASMHQMMTNVGGVGAWPQINQMSCAVGGETWYDCRWVPRPKRCQCCQCCCIIFAKVGNPACMSKGGWFYGGSALGLYHPNESCPGASGDRDLFPSFSHIAASTSPLIWMECHQSFITDN